MVKNCGDELQAHPTGVQEGHRETLDASVSLSGLVAPGGLATRRPECTRAWRTWRRLPRLTLTDCRNVRRSPSFLPIDIWPRTPWRVRIRTPIPRVQLLLRLPVLLAPGGLCRRLVAPSRLVHIAHLRGNNTTLPRSAPLSHRHPTQVDRRRIDVSILLTEWEENHEKAKSTPPTIRWVAGRPTHRGGRPAWCDARGRTQGGDLYGHEPRAAPHRHTHLANHRAVRVLLDCRNGYSYGGETGRPLPPLICTVQSGRQRCIVMMDCVLFPQPASVHREIAGWVGIVWSQETQLRNTVHRRGCLESLRFLGDET
eukprot:COSAG02_NODE_248_length_27133_cov_45.131723_27_plen_312_part_00